MNHVTYIPIVLDQFNQLVLATGHVNDMAANSKEETFRAPTVAVKQIKVIPQAAEDHLPALVDVEIRFKDLFALFELAKHFGIILEKVSPQTI